MFRFGLGQIGKREKGERKGRREEKEGKKAQRMKWKCRGALAAAVAVVAVNDLTNLG